MRRSKIGIEPVALKLAPVTHLDVSRKGFEGLHQLRIFRDVTPDVFPNTGIFVVLVNQHRKASDTRTTHPAGYTGRLATDAVPVEFIDLDKLYYGIVEAKRLQEEFLAQQSAEPTHRDDSRELTAELEIPKLVARFDSRGAL